MLAKIECANGSYDQSRAPGTVTDALGRWRFSGNELPTSAVGLVAPRGELLFSKAQVSVLLRSVSLFPRRAARPSDDQKEKHALPKSDTFKTTTCDVVLARPCGGLDVLVTKQGKPEADARGLEDWESRRGTAGLGSRPDAGVVV